MPPPPSGSMGGGLIRSTIFAVGVLLAVVWPTHTVQAPKHPPSTTTSTTTTTTTASPPTVDPALVEAWGKVAVCESGGWVVLGSAYPNSLGITAANWYQFGGTEDVSPEAQVMVAERFRAHYGISIPYQGGCAGAW